MRLFVRTLRGATVAVDAAETETVRSLKRRLVAASGLEVEEQRLSHGGRQLRDGYALGVDAGLSRHATLHLSARLRGGCLPHSIKLYLRCLHLFKVFISLYMFIMGIIMITDLSIHQAYGSQFVFYGLMVLLLAVLKPINIAMGHYGSTRHNKFALLIIVVFDSTVIFLQSSLGIIFIVAGTSEFPYALRKDCGKSVLAADSPYSTQDCKEYWDSDRTAGFRLAWMSTYHMGVRENDEGEQQKIELYQDEGMCCGFGPPMNCEFIENKDDWPTNLKQDQDHGGMQVLGKDMLKQRVTCSAARKAWYPTQPGVCMHYDDLDFNEVDVLGCRYDWATGLCLSKAATGSSKGCAASYEDRMNEKLYPQGAILFGSIILEGFTVFAACFFCWKRKEDDVLPVTYIYSEPWDPVKEGKLKLHAPQDALQLGGEDE